MDAFQTALNAVLPTFILIGLGAAADRLFPKISIKTLSWLSVYLLIPALIINALAETDIALGGAALLTLAYLIYLLLSGLVAYAGSKSLTAIQRRGVIVTTMFGNTGNMGLPITLFAYGEAGLERAVILLVVSLALMFSLGPNMLSGESGSLEGRFLATLKLPPIWATLIGIGLNATGVGLTTSLERSISLLSGATIPILLISLGIQMHRSWTWEFGKAAVRTTVARLVAGPFVAYGAAKLVGLAQLDTQVLVLSAAMPAAVTMFVIAVEVKGDFLGVGRSVMLTTLGSLLAITLVLLIVR